MRFPATGGPTASAKRQFYAAAARRETPLSAANKKARRFASPRSM